MDSSTKTGIMIRNIVKGIADYSKALDLINKLKLWRYVFVVGLISVVLGVGLIYFGYSILDGFIPKLQSLYPFEWGKDHIDSIIKYLGIFILILFGMLFYKYMVFILFVPFLGPLSEKIEEHLTGHKAGYSFLNFGRLLKDIFRGIIISIRLIFKELFWMILLFFLGIIPIFSPFVPVIAFFIQSFYAGYGNFDWALERFYSVRGRISFVQQNKSLTLGNGIPFMILLSIPILGFFLAPVLSVGAATISVIEKLQEERLL